METPVRTCIDCGRALAYNVRGRNSGRPALRCGECKRGRRRIKERADVVCLDCGAVFKPPGQTGSPPKRCESCRAERKRVTDAAKTARFRAADPERQKAYSRKSHEKLKQRPDYAEFRNNNHLKYKYGITRAELDAMIAAQNNKCAICGGGRNGPGARLHVDHCHTTDKVRGLLCGKCNTAIGLLDDDPERAESAAAYLRR